MTQVQEIRLWTGKHLVPSGLGARMRKEKAERARKEAEIADEEEGSKQTISFGAGGGNTKTATPMKSALRKGPKETVKVFKHNLVVDIRIRVTYEKKEELSAQKNDWLSGGRPT